MSANQGDGRPQDGQVVEVSPIAYDENNMPRTVKASRFVVTVLEAEKWKKKIIKLCEKMEENKRSLRMRRNLHSILCKEMGRCRRTI